MPKKEKKAQKATKKAKKPERASFKGITKALRAYLADGPRTIPEMIAALSVTEEAVLFGLRRLGKSKKGILRSGMVQGRPCWWWAAEVAQAGDAAPAADTPGKAARSGRAAKSGKAGKK